MTPMIVVLCVASLTTLASGRPGPSCPYCREAVKKDIFMSRGWGAGGLPFIDPKKSPSRTAEKTPFMEESPLAEEGPATVGEPSAQYLMARRHHSPSERHLSAVPQLFMSYGWGPLGK